MRFLSALSDLMVPVLIFYVVGLGLLMKQDVFGDFLNGGEGRHADGDRNCADLNRADGGGRRAAVIGISGGIWKTAWNRAGTGGNPVCAGTARCCASLFQQRGGGSSAGSLQRGGL